LFTINHSLSVSVLTRSVHKCKIKQKIKEVRQRKERIEKREERKDNREKNQGSKTQTCHPEPAYRQTGLLQGLS